MRESDLKELKAVYHEVVKTDGELEPHQQSRLKAEVTARMARVIQSIVDEIEGDEWRREDASVGPEASLFFLGLVSTLVLGGGILLVRYFLF
jgi:hypothetical protein